MPSPQVVSTQALPTTHTVTTQDYSSRSLASTLPPEILSHIFISCRDSDLRYDPDQEHGRSWLAVTAVCTVWRRAAHGCTALWDHLDYSVKSSSTELANHMLLLSGKRALNVMVHFYRERDASFLDMLPVEAIQRTRSLTLIDVPFEEFQNIDEESAIVTGPAHVLELLNIIALPNEKEHKFPARFLGNHLPALRAVNLLFVSLHWRNIEHFSAVQGLCLTECVIRGRPTSMIQALRQMKSLRELALDVELGSFENQHTEHFCLPALTYLYINFYDHRWIAFLTRALSAPQLSHCEIWIRDPSEESLTSIVEFFKTSSGIHKRSVYKIELEQSALHIWDPSGKQILKVHVRFQNSWLTKYIIYVASAFNLSTIDQILFADYFDMDATSAITALASRIDSAQTIVLRGGGSAFWMGSKFDINTPPFFSSLKTVCLKSNSDYGSISHWLQARANRNAKVHKLVLSSPPPNSEILEELRQWVDTIEIVE